MDIGSLRSFLIELIQIAPSIGSRVFQFPTVKGLLLVFLGNYFILVLISILLFGLLRRSIESNLLVDDFLNVDLVGFGLRFEACWAGFGADLW